MPKSHLKITITCIIPVFNEEKHIGAVIDTVRASRQNIPMEIIVIDDGSSDNTPQLLKNYRDIRLISNRQNRGKSYSVARGIEAAKTDYVLLLDADLIGLTVENLVDLFTPIQTGTADIAMSIRRNSTLLDSSQDKLDILTGERILPRSLLIEHLDVIKDLPGFGLEVYINQLILDRQLPIKAVHWNNVLNMPKYQKEGLLLGWKAIVNAARDISKVVSFKKLVQQYFALRKLLVK